MKIVILLFTCITFLDFANPMIRRPEANPEALLAYRPRVYVHTPEDLAFSGYLQNLHEFGIPSWVTHVNPPFTFEERVYIKMPDGDGLIANLEPARRRFNMNDDLHEENRCFVSFVNGITLVAVLQSFNPGQPPEARRPICFVRMPDSNTVYMGELDFDNGHHPSWIE